MSMVIPAIRENVPLAPMTTLGVGGPARFYLRAEDTESVAWGVAWARERQLPLFVLGGGSNLVIADEGFPGLALQVAVHGIRQRIDDNGVELAVGAGENWHALVARAARQQWAGIECLAGIPGYVGATPVQNVGAYGQEVRESITRVEAFDLQAGEIVTLANADCAFGYRESRFKLADRGRFIILKVHFRLEVHGAPAVRYLEVSRQLARWDCTRPTLMDVRAAVLAIRRRKSMVLAAGDPNTRSAGSFFINPILSPSELSLLDPAANRGETAGERLLCYPTPDGRCKIPAAWLIEHAGYARGESRGPVGISAHHALALVNYGGATARDIITFAREIRHRVHARFGILLMPEPTFVGLSMDEDD